MKKVLSRIPRILSAVLLIAGISASAAAQAPGVKMYYPGASDPAQELKQNANAYIYFVTGTKAIEAWADVVVADQTIGTLKYRLPKETSPAGGTLTMYCADDENAVLNSVPAGNFTLNFYEVTYLDAEGAQTTWSDHANPYGSVTYRRTLPNGSVTAETGFEDKVIRSWYPADATDGVKTFTFSKAVDPANVRAYFVYGGSQASVMTRLPMSLSADGLTLTIDMRGKCYNPEALAPGVKFVDQNGNTVAPPTTISLQVENLNCLDGSKIAYTTTSLDGAFSTTLSGQIFQSYNYEDLTFATPKLTDVSFYAAANPEETSPSITEATDMMKLTVENAAVLASADVVLQSGAAQSVVPFGSYAIDGEYFDVPLSAEIRQAGSDNLIISLENATYNLEDGAEHTINPLNLAYRVRMVSTLAELREIATGTAVSIVVPKGIKVTLSNEMGYTFAEDATSAIQIVTPDYKQVLSEFTLVKGTLAGVYQGGGVFMLDAPSSDYTESFVDLSVGQLVESLDDVADGACDFRLVTFVANRNMPITVDDFGTIIIGETIPVVTEFVENYVAPAAVANVTGVFYNEPSLGTFLLVRSMADFNNDEIQSTEPTFFTVADIVALPADEPATVQVENMLVTCSLSDMGICFMQDATGGLEVAASGPAPFEQGTLISGTLSFIPMGNMIAVDLENTSVTAVEADVTEGTVIDPAAVSDPANLFRLVTFKSEEGGLDLTVEDDMIMINEELPYVDLMGVLPYDYLWPAKAKQITGLVIFMDAVMYDEYEDETMGGTFIVAPRSEADIVPEEVVGVAELPAVSDADADVYDLCGRLVRRAGSDSQLRPGLYILSNGRKLVK